MSLNTKTLLITGAAGFIGANLALRLLESKEPLRIVGLDNLNDYYDPSLKECRLVRPDRQAVEGAGASGIVGALSGDV